MEEDHDVKAPAISKDQPDPLEVIAELGRLQFSLAEAQIVVGEEGYDWPEGCAEERAYTRGRLEGEAMIRRAVFTSARTGSSPAQKQFLLLVEGTARENRKIGLRRK